MMGSPSVAWSSCLSCNCIGVGCTAAHGLSQHHARHTHLRMVLHLQSLKLLHVIGALAVHRYQRQLGHAAADGLDARIGGLVLLQQVAGGAQLSAMAGSS